jgi:hypothetical protein
MKYKVIASILVSSLLVFTGCGETKDSNTNLSSTVSENYLKNAGFEILTSDFVSDWISTDGAATFYQDPQAHSGSYYLMGSSYKQEAYTYQTININTTSFTTEDVDNGKLKITFGGYQSGWSTQTDNGNIIISFKNTNDTIISTVETGAFYSNKTWTKRENTAMVPSGTRSIVYTFKALRDEGTDNDAYLDDAFVYLNTI